MKIKSLVLAELIGICGIIIGAIFYNPWSWRLFLLWSVSAAITIATLSSLGVIRGLLKRRIRSVTSVLIGLTFFVLHIVLIALPILGLLVAVNGLGDYSPIKIINLPVKNMEARIDGFSPAGRSSSVGKAHGGNIAVVGYHVWVDMLPPSKGLMELRVNSDLYFKIKESNLMLNVEYSEGFLNVPWVHTSRWIVGDNKAENAHSLP